MNYYRRYVGDYMRDTAHLSPTEHGIYTMLLDLQYATEKSLPVDERALCIVCRARTPSDEAAVHSVAQEFFPIVDGERWNPRARRELSEALPAIERMRKNGAAAANKRWHGDPTLDATLHTRLSRAPIHPPTSNLQPPTTNRQPPAPSPDGDAPARVAKTARPSRLNGAHVESLQAAARATWSAYSDAYRERYGCPPTRNARVNAQIAQLVQRLGAGEAPQVAGYYVTHPDAFYVKKGHAIGPLVNDCEKLRTEWATGRRVTSTRAQQIDRTGTQGDIVNEILHDRGERPR